MHSAGHVGDTHPGTPVGGSGKRGRFLRHYVEMVVAMFAGMLVLGGALRAVLALSGIRYTMDRYPALMLVEMACTMALGMGAWMRLRGHGWPGTAEMCVAMVAPAVVLVPLTSLGIVSGGTAMGAEHAAMFILMLLVMMRRRVEYQADAHG